MPANVEVSDRVVRVETPEPLEDAKPFHYSNAKHRLLNGGYGAGKTFAAVWEIIQLLVEHPGTRWLCTRKLYDDLRETVQRVFLQEVPPQLVRDWRKGDRCLELYNGSMVYFRGLKDDPQRLGSWELGGFSIHEAAEVEEQFFTMLLSRIRQKQGPRRSILETNPPDISHWIYKRWVLDHRPDYQFFSMSSRKNPFLPPHYVSNLCQEYPPEWIERYIDGKWGYTPKGAPVYGNVFKEDVHTGEFHFVPSLPLYRSWDFGWHHPCVVFAQEGVDESFRVLREFMGDRTFIRPFAQQVLTLTNRLFGGAHVIDFCDPAGAQSSDKGPSSVQELNYLGIYPTWRPSNVVEGLELITRMLQTLKGGKPWLLFDKAGCPILIQGFKGGYHRKKDKNTGAFSDEPVKDGFYEHSQDALRYMVVNLFGSQPRHKKWEDFDIQEPSYGVGGVGSEPVERGYI